MKVCVDTFCLFIVSLLIQSIVPQTFRYYFKALGYSNEYQSLNSCLHGDYREERQQHLHIEFQILE